MRIGSRERIVAASPLRVRLVDNFTGRAPDGPIELSLARRAGATWLPVGLPHLLKADGELAFAGLGRVRTGRSGEQFDLRITAAVPRMVAEPDALVLTVTTWTPDAPPPLPQAREIRCHPGPDYRFRNGVPLVAGRVLDAAGDPVARAAVTATETVLGAPVTEEVRTGGDGWFRLPLRWSSGLTQVDATRDGATGSATVNVPGGLGTVLLITLT